ncbi:SWPV1-009 [Shearwaterpox virus]|uniref:SWPV1-009 n=1 Tax=Shearwaterpox virus TaxID=1974596 RepID=A0A1V0S7N4_CNPV|nr:SWPV1-009 [Shearwaterpox virus]
MSLSSIDKSFFLYIKNSEGRSILNRYGLYCNMRDLLMNNILDINAIDNTGSVPLHYAVKNSYEDLIDLLISDININIPDNEGNTPLHYAGFSNYSPIILKLLFKGASITQRNNDGKTVMEYICKPRIKCIGGIKLVTEHAVLHSELQKDIFKSSGIDTVRKLINSENLTKGHEEKCFDELKLMKEFIIVPGITLLDVCTSKRHVNHKYSKILESINYDNFTIYKNYIKLCVNEAISREAQIQSTIKLLDDILVVNNTKWSELPYNLRYHISELMNTT